MAEMTIIEFFFNDERIQVSEISIKLKSGKGVCKLFVSQATEWLLSPLKSNQRKNIEIKKKS